MSGEPSADDLKNIAEGRQLAFDKIKLHDQKIQIIAELYPVKFNFDEINKKMMPDMSWHEYEVVLRGDVLNKEQEYLSWYAAEDRNRIIKQYNYFFSKIFEIESCPKSFELPSQSGVNCFMDPLTLEIYVGVKLAHISRLTVILSDLVEKLPTEASDNKAQVATTTLDSTPCITNGQILDLYNLLNNDVITGIGFTEFITCFDLHRKPELIPTYKHKATMVYVLTNILNDVGKPKINAKVALSNFGIINLDQEKQQLKIGRTQPIGKMAFQIDKILKGTKK